MASFGKRLASLRKEKELSQTDLANQFDTSVSVISRYDRDEMVPSIDVVKKLAGLLDTTVGYLLGENYNHDLFKIPRCSSALKNLEVSAPKNASTFFLLSTQC
jgi:transcriptional regulator with XRE-family HTH domain